MTELATSQRPKGLHSATSMCSRTCRHLPAAGWRAWVSILHRISGFLMFLLLPFIIWMFDTSLYPVRNIPSARFTAVFDARHAWVFAGVVCQAGCALALIWAYLHHFIAGLRHLWMDVQATARRPRNSAKASAVFTLALSVGADADPAGAQALWHAY